MSTATEDYLKRIYAITESSDTPLAPLGEIAHRMGVTGGTVTSMMKSLAEAGLVDYLPRTGATLTESGLALAISVIRKHRLVELFLVNVLGLDWTEVHAEAELLEHAISNRVLERMDVLLNRPVTDPHGDPIPTASGTVARVSGARLDTISGPAQCTVVRIVDDSPAFLGFVRKRGLEPGLEVRVVGLDTAADTITVETAAGRVTLGLSAAANVEVAVEPEPVGRVSNNGSD
jgi:DtxR family Mn-dependent transcriptional regulator